MALLETAEENRSWFLIHTNPRQEDRTVSNLRAWNVETFAPQIREWSYNKFTGIRTSAVKPLFSRYVFARFDLYRHYHKVRYSRGVHDVVSFGDAPQQVDDAIVELIRARTGKDGFVMIGPDFNAGDAIVVVGGALKNLTGVFERDMKDSERVVVLLDAISFHARLEIDRNLIRKVGAVPA